MAQTENASITPVFYTEVVQDVVATRLAGRPIMVEEDRVEYRIAGNRNFVPHFQAHEFHEWVEGEQVTHAMRWPNEYRKFKETGGNVSKGTPLQNLPGLTPVQISTLKALAVFSIEALANMEGRELKNLGPGGHSMKQAAQKYLSAAGGRTEMKTVMEELAALKAQNEELARIVAASRPEAVEQPVYEPVSAIPEYMAPGADEQVVHASANNHVWMESVSQPESYDGVSDDDLKAEIKKIAGRGVPGQPNRATLISMLNDLKASQE